MFVTKGHLATVHCSLHGSEFVDHIEDSRNCYIERHMCACTSNLRHIVGYRIFRNCMRNAEVLCTPSFMACTNILFGRMNTVF